MSMTWGFLGLVVVMHAASAPTRAPVDQPMTVVVHLSPDVESKDERPRTFKVVPGEKVSIHDLELGESVEGALVEVIGGASEPAIRVQMQYETSVSIMNEGPHLDLLEWKHFTSAWLDLERDSKGRFRVGTVRDDERSQFPQVNRVELLEAVRTAGGDGWAHLVKGVSSPLEYPATVDLSAIRLRLVYGKFETTFVVEFRIPLGC